MVKSISVRILIALILCMAFIAMLANGVNAGVQSMTATTLLQFTSSGHVLGFSRDGVIIGSGSHMLRTRFVNANTVDPKADDGIAEGQAYGMAPRLDRVTYNNVWEGVTVVYEASEGAIVESIYYVDTGRDIIPASNIRLNYNRPVSLDRQGNLVIAYETGIMMESAPVAWQEVDGKRVPVSASFVLYGEREAGFTLGDYVTGIPVVIDPDLSWDTFLGGSGSDYGYFIAVDGSGNVYVTGESNATWGTSPKRAFGSLSDAFVAKIGNDGSLAWNTFLGGSGSDAGRAVAVDGSGNVYVTGTSTATWPVPSDVNLPVRNYTSGSDVFVAKLGNNGVLAWNTFLGGSGEDYDYSIAVEGGGNVFVSGYSNATWPVPSDTNLPVRAYTSQYDAFAARLGNDGVLAWNTFLGGSGDDYGKAVAVDGSGNIYVVGDSEASWQGSFPPKRDYYGSGQDAFAARLDSSSGAVNWNTFLGGSGQDIGYGIAADNITGTVYVTGVSYAAWGSPVRGYTHADDAFAARLGNDGVLAWNTFLGGSGSDGGYGIALDSSGHVYVVGESDTAWGSPVRGYMGPRDAFAASCNSTGYLNWNTFLGSSGDDFGRGIGIDGSGSIYVAGASSSTWPVPSGTNLPVRAYTSQYDAFAAKIAGTEKAITSYSFQGLTQAVVGTVTEGTHTITLTVPYGTAVGALVATFTTTGASVAVGGTPQVSGTTANDFSNPVTYRVTAADASFQDYVVTVTVALNTAKAITAFSFQGLNPAVVGTVNEAAKAITLTVPYGTNVTALVPTITITGASVNPASGAANNFTTPQTYTVTAADASNQAYVVTATVSPAPPAPPPTPSNPLIGTGMPSSHGGSGAGSISTTTMQMQTVSLPNIQPQSASLSATTVTPGTPVTVMANIINKSVVNGNKKVTLYVNGQIETTQGVTVNSGGSTHMIFSVTRNEPGDYSVYVDGVPAGSFKVELFRESDGILIFSAALVALAFLIGMVMLWRRQQRAG